MNNCTFLGRLGQDPVIREVGDTVVCNFSLAVNKYVKNGENETLWIKCSVWGKRAEAIADYCKSGNQLCVTGEIDLDVYVDMQGVSRSSLKLTVNNFSFASSNQESQQQQEKPKQVVEKEEDDYMPF